VRIDLHTHSTASDGTDTPAELIRNAAAAGLDVVALTDHDTVGGHSEAEKALRELDGPRPLTLVTGAELSCRVGGVSLHLLAYLFDPQEPELHRERELVRDDRTRRARAMVAKLIDLGIPVTWERVAEIAGEGAVGRPHVAQVLIEAGLVGSIAEAFTPEWIGPGGRAYVEKHELDPFEAVRLVRNAGGVTVFAHPAAVKRGECVPDSVIFDLAAAGLDGIEVDHMDHDEPTRARLRGIAAELGLLVTGSSDYHGTRKTIRLGDHVTDPAVYEEIVQRATGAAPLRSA